MGLPRADCGSRDAATAEYWSYRSAVLLAHGERVFMDGELAPGEGLMITSDMPAKAFIRLGFSASF